MSDNMDVDMEAAAPTAQSTATNTADVAMEIDGVAHDIRTLKIGNKTYSSYLAAWRETRHVTRQHMRLGARACYAAARRITRSSPITRPEDHRVGRLGPRAAGGISTRTPEERRALISSLLSKTETNATTTRQARSFAREFCEREAASLHRTLSQSPLKSPSLRTMPAIKEEEKEPRALIQSHSTPVSPVRAAELEKSFMERLQALSITGKGNHDADNANGSRSLDSSTDAKNNTVVANDTEMEE
ncbi:hypothetical protein V8F20_008622 [Naviculisporaceae sp. PSN 640]